MRSLLLQNSVTNLFTPPLDTEFSLCYGCDLNFTHNLFVYTVYHIISLVRNSNFSSLSVDLHSMKEPPPRVKDVENVQPAVMYLMPSSKIYHVIYYNDVEKICEQPGYRRDSSVEQLAEKEKDLSL